MIIGFNTFPLPPHTHTLSPLTTPKEKTSAAGLMSPPLLYSGAMYTSVPTTVVVWVVRGDGRNRTTPKSPSLPHHVSVSKMFALCDHESRKWRERKGA